MDKYFLSLSVSPGFAQCLALSRCPITVSHERREKGRNGLSPSSSNMQGQGMHLL